MLSPIFAGKMCEAGIISAGLHDNPLYNNIETQFTSMLSFNETKEEFEKDCQAFLTALASQGRSFARISKRIAQKWRDTVKNEIALKCREPSPAHMQMSTCAYLISM